MLEELQAAEQCASGRTAGASLACAGCRSPLFTSLADPLDGEHVQELSNLTGLTSSPSTSNTTTDERGCTVSSLTTLSGGMRVRTQPLS